MRPSRHSITLTSLFAAALVLTACGSEDAAVEDELEPVEESEVEESEVEESEVEGHSDEDHDDEDHDDEVHDDEVHDDEVHGDESGGLGAHEHGTAELSVAWIDADVAIDLVSPTFNVFGFEYEPTTDEDLAIEADRIEALSATSIITINDEAGCTVVDPVEADVEREGSHSEITVSWLFSCDDPDAIGQVDASELFAEFPNFEDVDVQWISESDQSAAELSPSSTTFSLRP